MVRPIAIGTGSPAARQLWLLLILLVPAVSIGLYLFLYRNVSNHKLLSQGAASLVSIALTLLLIASTICLVGIARWLQRRVHSYPELTALITKMPIPCWMKCRIKVISVAFQRGNKRLLFLLVSVCIITVIMLSGWIGSCRGSLRTLSDVSGNRVQLCAKGTFIIGHVPSSFFLRESLMRFLGDTFLFRDELTIPHLDWRTAVLETKQCQDVLKHVLGNQTIHPNGCNNTAATAIGPSPTEGPWQKEPERDEFLLAPFRVSNELLKPNALQQANLVRRQLGECRFDSASRIAFESSSYPHTSLRDPLVLKAKSKHGNGIAIVLSGFNSAEKNLYHVAQMDSGLYCLFLALQNAASSVTTQQSVSVILPVQWSSPMGNAIARALAASFEAEVVVLDQNYTFIQQQSYQNLIHVHGPYGGDKVSDIVRSGSLGFNWPLWDSFKFEQNRLASPFGMAFANAVRSGNRAQLSKQKQQPVSDSNRNYVLIVQRRNSRRLVGSRSGTFSEVVDAMCSMGLPIKVVEFETLAAEEQIQAVSSSVVMVAAHGAGISHAAWMRPGTAVVEVLMRQGFAGSDYHKADFANLVRFFGKNYFYYDAVSLGPQDATEISAHTVVVDAEEFAQAVLCLYEKFRNAY